MNIQELVRLLTDWTDQSGFAQWTLTHARGRGLILTLSARMSSRRVQFCSQEDWPEAGLVRGAMHFVDPRNP